MTMTPDDVNEAQQLLSAHNSLRWNLARNGHRRIGMYACDDDSKTTQPQFPPPLGRQIMLIALSLVEARLREIGVEPEQGLEHDCFQCRGTGSRR